MKKHLELSLPQLGLIAATRGMLGAGIALLLSERLSSDQRKAVGWTLTGVGLLTTLPLAADLLLQGRPQAAEGGAQPHKAQPELQEEVHWPGPLDAAVGRP